MCSVVGYVGKNKSKAFILEGLSRLEYRGYDSAGFACVNPENKHIAYAKVVGGLHTLADKTERADFNGFVGIGHSRWATHGRPSEANAHPHFDCKKTVAIVHNGIVENYLPLKMRLEQQGHLFHSDTDTEVIAHLFESVLMEHSETRDALVKEHSELRDALVMEHSELRDALVTDQSVLRDVLVKVTGQLRGAYTCLVLLQDYPDTLVVIRRRSPLCIGFGDDEMFIASDTLAFAGKANKVLFVPDESFALVKKDEVVVYDSKGNLSSWQAGVCDVSWHHAQKNGYEHYMLKEIYEQKDAITKTVHALNRLGGVRFRDSRSEDSRFGAVRSGDLRFEDSRSGDLLWSQLGISREQVRMLEHIDVMGCGGSWHAAYIAQFYFEQIAQLPTTVHLASELRHKNFFPASHSFCIAISQSGETADTLEALRVFNECAIPTAALTNVASSTLVRDAQGFLLTEAGPEIAVASTKGFSTQIAALYWLAHRIALEKGLISVHDMEQASIDLAQCAYVLEKSIEVYKTDIVEVYAKKYAYYAHFILLGRHISYPFALEASLKLKEIAYIFSQSYPAGELKHGPLALIDEQTPVIIFSHLDVVIYQKLLANAQEVKARDGHIVAFLFEGQHELAALADLCFIIPQVKPLLGPLAMIGLMQFFAYALARERGLPIDKPRNLAKSVTVE